MDWRGLCGLRDILAHSYFRVRDDVLWSVVVDELPQVVAAANRLLAEADAESGT